MADSVIDKEAFLRRIRKLYSFWKTDEILCKADAIVAALGQDREIIYSKSPSVQTWLFGYEMMDTVIVFCKESIVMLARKNTIDFVKQAESAAADDPDFNVPQFTFLVRDKNDKSNFSKLVGSIRKSGKGKVLGEFSREKFPGEFMDAWRAAVNDAQFDKVDVSAPLAYVMAAKDETELITVKKACQATMDLFDKFLKEQLIYLLNKDERVKHSTLADQVFEAANNKMYMTGVDLNQLDICYPPIIQSGGRYALGKYCIVSDDNLLHFGAIVCMLGTRYKWYCSNIIRTLLVEPTAEMQANYDLLLHVEKAVLNALQHGVKLSDVYAAAVSTVRERKPQLVDKMTETAGFAMGIEFRERSLLISSKSDVVAQKGMVFNINVGFSELVNPDAKTSEGKNYALYLGDTVLVSEDSPASLLTPLEKKTKQISYFTMFSTNLESFDAEEDAEQERKEDDAAATVLGRGHSNAVLANHTEKSVESLELSTSARCSELRQQCLTAECELEDKLMSLEEVLNAVKQSSTKLQEQLQLNESELSTLKERNRWLYDQLQSTVHVVAEKNAELVTMRSWMESEFSRLKSEYDVACSESSALQSQLRSESTLRDASIQVDLCNCPEFVNCTGDGSSNAIQD